MSTQPRDGLRAEGTLMHRQHASSHARDGERGQILVVAALALMALIAGVALVIEGGNAYAHQRIAQNAADSLANAGATVLAERIGGATWVTDVEVAAAMDRMRDANGVDTYEAHYSNVTGGLLASDGTAVVDEATAAAVGSGVIPPGTQGVRVTGDQSFGTTFARAIGINSFTASADATAVAGALTGGSFMPVALPVSMTDCDGSGDTVTSDAPWRMSNPPTGGNPYPDGQEYIVPLCKTGGGSFMILDLDEDLSCSEEVSNPPRIQFESFPVDVATDVGNNCAGQIADAVADANLQGTVVLVPVCDGQCSTENGVGGTYHIIRIAAFFLDYISYSNNPNNSGCQLNTSPTYGTDLENLVGGNGSSSCMVGWFVRYVTSGPVGTGSINNGEAIGVQLIR